MLFAKEEVNTGRQLCIDFAKAFAIVFMVLSHPMEYTGIDLTKGLPYLITFIGSHQFAAPIFMLSMGIGFTYSRHNDPKTMLRRGMTVFEAGIMLNIVRSVAGTTAFLATGQEYALHLSVIEIVVVDIFQLAGLAMMLLGFLRSIRMPYWGILLLSVAMSLIGSTLHMVSSGNNLIDAFLGLFVGITSEYSNSYFPLLNWFIFVVVGYGLGNLLRRCANPKRLFAIVTPVAAVLYFGYILYAIPRHIGMFNTDTTLHFYQIRTFDFLISGCAALMTIGVGYFLMNLFPEGLQKQISRIAADLMRIYVLQWVLITWIISALMQQILGIQFDATATIIAGVCVLVASVLLARVKPFSKMKI